MSIFLLALSMGVRSQFVEKPLNYQVSGDYYLPCFFSVVDIDRAWLGTKHYLGTGQFDSYTYAVHTNDGGDTWIFDSIPAPAPANISSVCALDENTCFYAMIENNMNGSVWKTIDGGATWTRKTTNQFLGGFLNFYHAFTATDGLAMGDPNGGYFEIYSTSDGGETWTRIDSVDIPASLIGEFGNSDSYSALGDNIWFGSNLGRCFKSVDRGQHWTVSSVGEGNGEFDVAFSTPQKGVFFDYGFNSSTLFYKSEDGGNTWVSDSIEKNKILGHICPVSGIDGGFVITDWDPVNALVNVFFTPDFFSTIIQLDSSLWAGPYVSFSDAYSGWLCGWGNDTNDIFKFTGVLTSVYNAVKAPEKLSIIPNPSSTDALVKIPATLDSKSVQLRVYDMAGKIMEYRTIDSSTGWAALNASGYPNGIYLVEILSADRLVDRQQWVVNH